MFFSFLSSETNKDAKRRNWAIQKGYDPNFVDDIFLTFSLLNANRFNRRKYLEKFFNTDFFENVVEAADETELEL